jgi:hypothetical protein
MRLSGLRARGSAFFTVGLVLIGVGSGRVYGSVFTIPGNQLLTDAEFGVKAWGPGTLVSRAAGPGDAVDFAFTGLGTSGTGVKDDYPVDPVYGQVLPSHGNGDFSGFSGYGLRVENLDDAPVWVQLSINTGFTGPSGTPSNDATNNTYWTSSPGWGQLDPGDNLLVILDFGEALAYQIWDNKVPHTGGGMAWPDGGVYSVNSFDRKELSAIGFEVADFSGSNPDVVLRLSPVSADAGIDVVGWHSGAPLGRAIQLETYPNPGRVIGIHVTCDGRAPEMAMFSADLAIYDVNGRLVRLLWAGQLAHDGLELAWDGTDQHGVGCCPGLYWLSVKTPRGDRTSHPVVLLSRP